MKIRKGQWQYPLPKGTEDILRVLFKFKKFHFVVHQVRYEELMFHKDAYKKGEPSTEKLVKDGHIFVAITSTQEGRTLCIFPTPDKDGNMEVLATKVIKL